MLFYVTVVAVFYESFVRYVLIREVHLCIVALQHQDYDSSGQSSPLYLHAQR